MLIKFILRKLSRFDKYETEIHNKSQIMLVMVQIYDLMF